MKLKRYNSHVLDMDEDKNGELVWVEDLRKFLKTIPRYEPEFYFNADGSECLYMEETKDGDYIEIKELLALLEGGK